MADRLSVLKERLAGRIRELPERGCFLCRWILEDLERHGKLTDVWPEKNHDGSVLFPAKGKLNHIWLEGFWSKDLEPLT